MFPLKFYPISPDYSAIERRARAAYGYGMPPPPPAVVPVPTFTETPKARLNVGGDAYRISSGATYAVRQLSREVSLGVLEKGRHRVELAVPAASFNAKQLRELTTHLNALASAMEATA